MTLPTCCKAKGASCEIPPDIIVIVGGNKAMDPETNKVPPACKFNKGMNFFFITMKNTDFMKSQ